MAGERRTTDEKPVSMHTHRHLLLALLLLLNPLALASTLGPFPALFVFGDSLSDTGNGVLSGCSNAQRTTQVPYGETFPGFPASRFSDGHVLVDLLAIHLGLPLLNPYLNMSADFRGGVNYAVGGSTALNTTLLASLGIDTVTNLSLGVQLSWHLHMLLKVQASNGRSSGSPAASSFLEGLYVFEIGGNDYKYSYSANYSVSYVVSTILPLIIERIHDATETLLKTGARNFLFISTTPLGCAVCILATESGTEDSDGCLEEFNYASYLLVVRLHEEVRRFRVSHPAASFIFLDFYGAYKHIMEQPDLFGFSEARKACCGAGEYFAYNFNSQEWCNSNSTSLCDNPAEYVFWDGIHYTDGFTRQIFNQTVLTGSYLDTSQRSSF